MLVVLPAPLRVGEHIIGLHHALEAGGGFGTGPIRVVRLGQGSECGPDAGRVGVPGDAEDQVVALWRALHHARLLFSAGSALTQKLGGGVAPGSLARRAAALQRGGAPVSVKDMPRDEAGGVARQKERRSHHLLGLAVPAEGDAP